MPAWAPPDTTPPSVPTGLTAAAASCAQINLSWSPSTDGGSHPSGVKGYNVYRGGIFLIFVTTTNTTDSGLSGATTYFYQVSAVDNANNVSARSSTASATTFACPDTTPPTVPTGLTGTAVSCTNAILSWNPSTDPAVGGQATSGVTGYNVYRNGALLKFVTTTNTTDSGLSGDTSYGYQVSALDNANNTSALSSVVSVATPFCPDTVPPTVPSGLVGNAVTCTNVSLSWAASTDQAGSGETNSGLYGYNVYRNGTFLEQVLSTSASDATVPSSTNVYSVSAVDNAGNESILSSPDSVSTPACLPIVPTGLINTTTTCSNVTLSWNASTDPGGPGLAGYKVYKNGSLLLQEAGIGLVDNTLSASTTYSYAVSAVDIDGRESAQSSALSVTTPACPDTTPPTVNLTSPANGSTASGTIALSATASDNSGGSGVAKVEFYVDSGLTTVGTAVNPPYTVSFDTTTLTPGAHNFYAKAYDLAGNFANSASVSVTICAYSLSSNNVSYASPGGSGSFSIASGSSCPWAASTVSSWLHVTSSGTGSGTVNYSVDPNPAASSRSGGISVGSQFFSVTQSRNLAPQAVLGPSPFGVVGALDSFNGSSSYDPDGSVVAYLWNFGDGSTVSGAAVSHVFSSPGTYTISLTVTDNLGLAASAATPIIILPPPFTAAPDFVWAKQFGGSGPDQPLNLALDSSGNPLLTGSFSSNADFGGLSLSSAGASDIFLAKYNSSSALMLAKSFGGPASDSGSSMAVDSSGNVLLTGYFSSTANLGGTLVTSAGASDIFLAKYTPAGNLVWAKRFGGSDVDFANGIAVDSANNIILTGGFASPTVDFGGIILTNSGTGLDLFLAKYSGADGTFLWAKQGGGSGTNDVGRAVAVDHSDNVFVAGVLASTNATFSGIPLTGSGSTFLIKCSSAGAFQWALQAPGANGQSLAVDSSGNVMVAGDFNATNIDFGAGPLPYRGSNDIFAAKFTPNGDAVLWQQAAGGSGNDSPRSLLRDSSGNVYLTGWFDSANAVFGGITLTNSSPGPRRIFISKLSGATGNFLWAKSLGGSGNDEGQGLAVDAAGNLFAAGDFSSPVAAFDSFVFTNLGSSDMFLGKLAFFAPFITSQPQGQIVPVGSAVVLSVSAYGGALSYQWQLNGTNLTDGGRFSGTATPYLSLLNVQPGDSGAFSVLIGNSSGLIHSSNALLTVEFPPVVAIIDPTNGSVFSALGPVPVTSVAGDADGQLARLDFYASAPQIGTNVSIGSLMPAASGTNIYSFSWTNVAPGNYTLALVATDNLGLTSTSAPVNLAVIPIILVNDQYNPSNQFTFLASDTVRITMTNPIPNGPIRYTTDENVADQDLASFAFYTGAFYVTNSVRIRAVTTDPNFFPVGEAAPVTVTIIPLYSLAYSTPGGGSIAVSPSQLLFASNTVVTLSATPSNKWSFLGWTGGVSTNATNVAVTISSNLSVQANFGTSLSNIPPIGGSISNFPMTNIYAYGSTVRLTAVPFPANYFFRWGGDAIFGTSNSPLRFVVTNGTPMISAAFVSLSAASPANQFALNVQIGTGDGDVARDPFGTLFPSNTTATLSAAPVHAQTFVNWSGDTNSAQNPLTVVMNTNKTIIANFATNSPPSVAITNPAMGAVFTNPATIELDAYASSSNGVVAQVGFYAGAAFIGAATNAPFSFIWTNAPVGTNVITAVALDNFGLSATSAPVTITVVLPPPGPAIFSLSASSYSVAETNGYVDVTILKSFNSLAGSVNGSTADGTAVAIANNVGNYGAVATNIPFMANETNKPIHIGIKDNSHYYAGDRTFTFSLNPSGDGSSIGSPSVATITILEVNSPASSNSVTTHLPVNCLPDHSGQLTVNLVPANSGGQWRVVREIPWRPSGDTAGSLASGAYEIQFKPVPGMQQPANTNVTVPGMGVPTPLQTNFPYSRLVHTQSFGSLRISLVPSPPQAQWRLLGDTNWLNSGVTLSNLIATNYVIELSGLTGYATPPLQSVVVPPDPPGPSPTNYSYTYLQPDNLSWALPGPILFFPNDPCSPFSGDYVYNYNGQLLTDVGFGSGCVVKQRVVLTAAHVIFDDLALTFVSNPRWFFQRQAGQYEPPLQTPRGSYALSGYAAARTNDSKVLLLQPGEESVASQNRDVAALFFFEDAGRGGQSGYLVATNATGGQWLQSGLNMTLAGYPVENVSDNSRGKLYGTALTAYTFDPVTTVTNGLFNTTNVAGYPGMSGGPLCVQYQGTYYPAGVYLGGSQRSIVRAIDFEVADIINKADVSGNTGDLNTGGGVLKFFPAPSGSASLGYVQVTLGPSEAVAAGAGWRLLGDTIDFSNDPNFTYGLTSSDTNGIALEFKQIQGWSLPGSRSVVVTLGSATNISALYSKIALTPAPPPTGSSFHWMLSGGTGRVYSIRFSASLLAPASNWLELLRLTNLTGLTNFTDATTGAQRFYRAVEMP